ncbi:MAG: NTPase [Chloroflexi bacterium]|nr:NTPase [Chloroflexota bacterium]
MAKVLLLSGKPGTGKTSLIKEAIDRVKIEAGGFYTQEIRSAGVRQGFKIITLDGKEAILAHINISSPYQVSKYNVDIDRLNEVGISAIQQALKQNDLIVIDEIGKMELLSLQFQEVVLQAIQSGKKILGTVMFTSHPFADEVKRHPEVTTLVVSGANRNEVLSEILAWLQTA